MTYIPTNWITRQTITTTLMNHIEKGISDLYANNRLNVKDFGALGNGVADDTAAIQSALDAANSKGGGEVYFPAGVYMLSKSLTVYSYIKMVGASEFSVLIKQTNDNAGHIYAIDVRYFAIKDIAFEGLGMDSAGGGGIFLSRQNNDNTEGINFENVTVQKCAGSGITISCPITSIFTNVVCLGLVGSGFSFYGSGTSVVMNACYAITCTQAGFDFDQLNYSVLNACAVEVCGIGYYLHHNCNNVSLIGCGAEDQIPRSSAYPGIDFQIEGGVGNTIISGYSRNNTLAGIRLMGGGKPVILGYRQIGTCPNSIITDSSVSGAVIQGESVSSPMSLAAGTVGSTGTTSNRPSVNRYIGQKYYDTTLGKPIFWNGSKWTDAVGTSV
ncbi:glycosyl hydrolase family 28-related protein [Oenococcus sp.]|uniref:glycosyl hydrolase family 28-related protein n=1 Tax=Oenococcus sp. TaxID=1979414 RepID=UPI0039EB9610